VVAGTHHKSGLIDGEPSEALFYAPASINFCKSGHLLVAEYTNNTVRLITNIGKPVKVYTKLEDDMIKLSININNNRSNGEIINIPISNQLVPVSVTISSVRCSKLHYLFIK